MAEESIITSNRSTDTGGTKMSKNMKLSLLVFNCLILGIGNCIAPITNRLYSVKGGERVWLMCALETGGFPFLLIPMLISYVYRQRTGGSGAKFISISPRLIIYCAIIGCFTGLDDYMDSAGVSRLPVSTYSLVLSSQLGFTALFAWMLVKQKFNFLRINSIMLLIAGSAILAFNSGSDSPNKISRSDYAIGFLMTLGAAILYGFVLPAIELMYKHAKQTITYSLVMEMQFIMALFATLVCVIGMAVNHDFQAIPREADKFELGKGIYYLVLIGDAFLWQLFFLGAVGVIFCNSSLLSGIIISALLPVSEVLAVFIFGEKFGVLKGISLFLACWGAVSYFYAEILEERKRKRIAEENEKSVEMSGEKEETKKTSLAENEFEDVP